MSKLRLFLFSGIIAIALTIGFIEYGAIVLNSDHLIAQNDDNAQLVLMDQNKKKITISKGDWMLIKSRSGDAIYGSFISIYDGAIQLELKNKGNIISTSRLPNELISVIYIGSDLMSFEDRTARSLKRAGGITMAGAAVIGVSSLFNNNGNGPIPILESIFFGTLCGAMITGFYAIPSALVISFAQDAVSKKMAKEYIISTSEWKIIDQSVTN